MIPQNCFMVSQCEFIKELTSSIDNGSSEILGKRKIGEYSENNQTSPKISLKASKCIVLQRSSSQQDSTEAVQNLRQSLNQNLENISNLTSSVDSGQDLNHSTSSSTAGSEVTGIKQIKYLLNHQYECHKALIKHFLMETIMNEIVNLNRLRILPNKCQSLVLLLLKKCFNFDMIEKISKGSPRKYLFNLCDASEVKSTKSLSFLTECYLYGVKKQLLSKGQDLKESEIIHTLFDKLSQLNSEADFCKFETTIQDLVNYRPISKETHIPTVLSLPLLAKMKQIPEKTLNSFYAVKLKKFINELVDPCMSTSDMVDAFSNINTDISVFSEYMGKTQDQLPRIYHISALTLSKNMLS